MYPIERFLAKLKAYVRNKARPEGCIAESYVSNECLTFCSMYLTGIETKFNREERNFDREKETISEGLLIFSRSVRPFGASKYEVLSDQEFEMIQWYILNNCELVEPFFEKHKMELELQSTLFVEERHKKQFPSWFKRNVSEIVNCLVEARNELQHKYVPFHCRDIESSIQVFEEMAKPESCGIDDISYGILLKGLGEARRIDEAFQILKFVENGTAVGSPKLLPRLIYGLLNALLEAGDMRRANGLVACYRVVFNKEDDQFLLYNLLMKGYMKTDFPQDALTIR